MERIKHWSNLSVHLAPSCHVLIMAPGLHVKVVIICQENFREEKDS